MIWSGALMLNFLGEKEAADLFIKAIKGLTAGGKALTPVLGGHMKTRQVTNALMDHLRKS